MVQFSTGWSIFRRVLNYLLACLVVQFKPETRIDHAKDVLMQKRVALLLAGSAFAVLPLTGCSPTAPPDLSDPGLSSPTSVAPAPTTRDVATASTKLGIVVVNGKGMTAYFFDKDVANSGKSTCTGGCAAMWPAITSLSTTPTVDGVTGRVGTIAAPDGSYQVTIGGRPIYTFANDKAAGDVNGQGVGTVWHVLDASGKEIRTAP
jgi:predicted lipoprotein with Yx(FWY)xxD motif